MKSESPQGVMMPEGLKLHQEKNPIFSVGFSFNEFASLGWVQVVAAFHGGEYNPVVDFNIHHGDNYEKALLFSHRSCYFYFFRLQPFHP
jgi:hypothetical protein